MASHSLQRWSLSRKRGQTAGPGKGNELGLCLGPGHDQIRVTDKRQRRMDRTRRNHDWLGTSEKTAGTHCPPSELGVFTTQDPNRVIAEVDLGGSPGPCESGGRDGVRTLLTRKHLKQAQSAQTRLSGMLINAAENERSRVAAELHDDFSQRLAVIALKLENLAETVSPLSEEAGRQIREVVNSAGELGTDLHTLSHRLHSSTLESLGLAVVYCRRSR